MLTVRAIGKFHDNKGILLGYRIKDMSTGEEMNVHKNELKNAVALGKCIVDNMTLTSDGRLIGHATAKDRPVARVNIAGAGKAKPERKKPEIDIICSNGKKIACALSKYDLDCTPHVEGLSTGYTFEMGLNVTEHLNMDIYSNVRIANGKLDTGNAKKRPYKQMKEKILKLLAQNNVSTTISVEKGAQKYQYNVIVDNKELLNNYIIMNMIFILIENCMYDNKIKVVDVKDTVIVVETPSGINDVRKSLKTDNLSNI